MCEIFGFLGAGRAVSAESEIPRKARGVCYAPAGAEVSDGQGAALDPRRATGPLDTHFGFAVL